MSLTGILKMEESNRPIAGSVGNLSHLLDYTSEKKIHGTLRGFGASHASESSLTQPRPKSSRIINIDPACQVHNEGEDESPVLSSPASSSHVNLSELLRQQKLKDTLR